MRAVNPKHPKTQAPTVESTELTVAEIVSTAYHEGVEAACQLAEPLLSQVEVRAAITFCADEACVAAEAY